MTASACIVRQDMAEPLRVLDLFSGIGGFSLGLERAGMQTVAFCEIDPYCRRVLAKHWPEVPILGDVETTEFPAADVVCGGFPCQDLSAAGKRAGLSGSRSGLYRHLVRAIRVVRPQYAIVENVADLLGLGMGTVLGDLAETGYDAEWDCIQAAELGAPHERDRVWIVAHADEERRHGRAGRIAQTDGRVEPSNAFEDGSRGSDTEGVGRGTRRPWGLADGLPGLQDAPRWNPADANSKSKVGATVSWQECSAWPDEPALLGVDDGIPHRMDRVRSLGNSLLPQIPEMIGRAIAAARRKDAVTRDG